MKRLLFLFLGCAFSSCCVPNPSFRYFSIYNGSDVSSRITILTGKKKYLNDSSETKVETTLALNSVFSFKTPFSSKCLFSGRINDIEKFTLDGHVYLNHYSIYEPDQICISSYVLNESGLYYISIYRGNYPRYFYCYHMDISLNEQYDEYMRKLCKKIIFKYGKNTELNGKIIDGFKLIKVDEEKN